MMVSSSLQSTQGSYWFLPVNPSSHHLCEWEGLAGRLQLELHLVADSYPIAILFASFFWSTLWRCPFVDNRVTACQCTWFSGLLLVWGFLFCFVSLSCKKAVIFLYLSACLGETRQSERGLMCEWQIPRWRRWEALDLTGLKLKAH